MNLPPPYVQSYSFTAFQQGQGNGDFPGVNLDIELADLAAAIDGIGGFLQAAFRSDGSLTNGSVTRDALSSGIQIGLTPPTPWAPNTFYAAGDTVTYGFGLYYALADNLSTPDPADAAGDFAVYWQVIANFASLGLLADASVSTGTLVDASVTAPKLAASAVTTPALADGSVTRAKASADFGILPIGAEIDYSGFRPPTGWRWRDGKAYSRVTYAALFAVLTETLTANVVSGSTVLNNVSEDLTALGPAMLIGASIEGFGAAVGATVAGYSNNTIVMSAAATGNANGQTYTIFPHGNGDGATTFNVPDDRGRVTIGRDDMGGFAAGRMVGSIVAKNLGATGGEVVHVLLPAELAAHAHALTENPHTHGTTEAPHSHSYNQANSIGIGSGGGPGYSNQVNATTTAVTTNLTINSATTGITMANAGSNVGHNNVQPSRVGGKIIFVGVA